MWLKLLQSLGWIVKHKKEIEEGVELGTKIVHDIKDKK